MKDLSVDRGLGFFAPLRMTVEGCHPERSEGSQRRSGVEILRSAQNDSRRSVPVDHLKAELRTGSLNAYDLVEAGGLEPPSEFG